MILQIIGGVVKIGAMLLGDALLAKWLGTARLYWDKLIDPTLKQKTIVQYETLNKEFETIVNQKGPF